MAEAAAERKYDYIAITDHSKGLKIAGGTDEEQLEQQGLEVRALNCGSSFNGVTVLRSS
jgi:histidinol phosphatase-like PHP family hydrolase